MYNLPPAIMNVWQWSKLEDYVMEYCLSVVWDKSEDITYQYSFLYIVSHLIYNVLLIYQVPVKVCVESSGERIQGITWYHIILAHQPHSPVSMCAPYSYWGPYYLLLHYTLWFKLAMMYGSFLLSIILLFDIH